MRKEAYESHMRDLNRLVFAAEAVETPAMPDALRDLEHQWKNSPTSFDDVDPYKDQERTVEAAEALGRQWQYLCAEWYEALENLDLDDFAEELHALREKAKEARLAMIAFEEYHPPVPGSP